MLEGPNNLGTSISTATAYVAGTDALGPVTLQRDCTIRVTLSTDSAVIPYIRTGSTAANAVNCAAKEGVATVANAQYSWEMGFPKGTVLSIRFSGNTNINNLNVQAFVAR